MTQMLICERCSAMLFYRDTGSVFVVQPCTTCSMPLRGNVPLVTHESASKPEMVSGVDMAAGPDTTAVVSLRKAVDRFGNEIAQEADESWPLWEVWLEGIQRDDGRRERAAYCGSYYAPTLLDAAKKRWWFLEPQCLLDGSFFFHGRQVFDNEADAKKLYGW